MPLTAAEIAAAAAAAATAPVVEPEPVEPAAAEPEPVVAAAEPEPAAAPWTADITERFADEDVRAQVDAYLREKQQPYITKLEQERAEAKAAAEAAAGKTWVFERLNEDPTSLGEIAEQLYPGMGAQITALIEAGATPEVAVEAAAVDADPEEIPLSQLPADVREAVEFAREQRAAQAAAATAATAAEAEAAATVELNAWRDGVIAEQPDVLPSALMRYVATADVPDDATSEQLYAKALADYRADFPAPTSDAPTTVAGRAAANGGDAQPAAKSVYEAAGRIFDAARGPAR